MKVSKHVASLFACLGLMTVLTACDEQSEKDLIMEAQYCLDKADAGGAQSCVASLASVTSAQASALKCAAGFIDANVTSTSNLSAALTAIQNNNGSGTTTLFAALDFSSSSVDIDKTANYCSQSGQPGFALMGAMAKSATALASIASLSSCSDLTCAASAISDSVNAIILDYNNANGVIADMDANNVKAIETVASAVQTVYTATCGGTNNASSDICGPINDALTAAGITNIATADLVALGKSLLDQWK